MRPYLRWRKRMARGWHSARDKMGGCSRYLDVPWLWCNQIRLWHDWNHI